MREREREKKDEERGQEAERRKVNETEWACERKIGRKEMRGYKTPNSQNHISACQITAGATSF